MKNHHEFIDDFECAIDCFRPIIKCLRIKENVTHEPVCLSCFGHVKEVDCIKNWDVVVIKADFNECVNASRAMFVLQEKDRSKNIFRCFIIIHKIYFSNNENLKVINETKVTIFMHEFMHFLSHVYARVNNSPKMFFEMLNKRLQEKIDILNNKDVLELYKFFNNIKLTDDFDDSEYTEDQHFRLGKEDTILNYSDLYRNFLLSHQLFDEYFNQNDKDNFRDLWKRQEYGEAIDLYKNIAKNIAKEEWITENFAIHQAFRILNDYYAYKIL